MRPDEIVFGTIKEDRGWYFVEYCPPVSGYRFSTLSLNLPDDFDASAVAPAMEREAREWMARFPVPVVVTSFLLDGSVFRAVKHGSDNLMGWPDAATSKTVLKWEFVKSHDLPSMSRDKLMEIFAKVPSRTGKEIQEGAAKSRASTKLAWAIVALWVVVGPAAFALVEWSSELLGLLVMLYAIGKAAIKALQLLGYLPESKAQQQRAADELRMRHHHYHCIRNPKAFERLKLENLEREEIERTRAEAASLRA